MGLIHAVKSGNLEDVELALAQGADVNEVDDYGCTALFWAATEGFAEIVVRLIKVSGIKVDQQDTYMKQTPLMIAINEGNLKIVPILLEAKADPNMGDKDGFTSMHYAAWKNDLTLIQLLVKYNGSITVESNGHSTLLHAAAVGVTQHVEKWDLVKWLLGKGLDSEAINDNFQAVRGIFANKDPGFERLYDSMIGETTVNTTGEDS